jgi:hypothetical protein
MLSMVSWLSSPIVQTSGNSSKVSNNSVLPALGAETMKIGRSNVGPQNGSADASLARFCCANRRRLMRFGTGGGHNMARIVSSACQPAFSAGRRHCAACAAICS